MAKASKPHRFEALFKFLRRHHVHPATKYRDAVETAVSLLQGLNPGADQSKHFETAKQAVRYLLDEAAALNRLPLWDEVDLSSDAPRGVVPDLDQIERKEMIETAAEKLQGVKPTTPDLVTAMDTLHSVFMSMHLLFTFGVVSDEYDGIGIDDRYLCAALLGPIATLIARSWPPIRGQLRRRYNLAAK